MAKKFLDETGVGTLWNKIKSALSSKQDNLVSGDNIKTINGNSILGSGNITISGGGALEAFPVGAIYMSVNANSPASLFGGKWEQLRDRFLLGAGQYTNGVTGGETTVTLTTDQIPAHKHYGLNWGNNFFTNDGATGGDSRGGWRIPSGTWMGSAANSKNFNVDSTGGGRAHNNMPPYLAVNMWKRVG